MKKVYCQIITQSLFMQKSSTNKRHLTLPKQKKNESNLSPFQQLETYHYYLGGGNNCSLVGRILSTRKQWQQMTDSKYLFMNFRWQQTNKSYKYQNCIENKIFKHCLNHFEFHQELSNKEMLFRNLLQYCDTHKIDVFDIVPLTFILNFNNPLSEQALTAFVNFFDNHLPQTMKQPNRKTIMFIKKKRTTSHSSVDLAPKNQMNSKIKDTFLEEINSSYLWILKPTFQNRGQGIHVFNSLERAQTLINSYLTGEICAENKSGMSHEPSSPEIRSKSYRIREYINHQKNTVTSFVVQKYLEQPLLIDGRKFDIRMWVLISHEMKVYLFKQGYIRTSSFKYSTNSIFLNDNNVHLTNNAVQKHNSDYGKYQDGNQLSFKVLKNLIEKQGYSYLQVMSRIRWIVKITAMSVRKKLNKNQRANCFEIFGYDFMLDVHCKPWLIEVNTNPCIEESSQLLEALLPRMLDNAFSITLDKIFDSEKKGYTYSIQNEYNTDNLWQLITDLKKSSSLAISQHVMSETKKLIQ